jgi:hypothetical protein
MLVSTRKTNIIVIIAVTTLILMKGQLMFLRSSSSEGLAFKCLSMLQVMSLQTLSQSRLTTTVEDPEAA